MAKAGMLLGAMVLAFVVIGTTSLVSGTVSAQASLPTCKFIRDDMPTTSLKILPPAPYVPATNASYLGVWEGSWRNDPDNGVTAPSVLVIWGVNDRIAVGLYQFGGTRPVPMPLVIQPDGSYSFRGTFFNWKVSDDADTLHGIRTVPGLTSVIDMHLCKPAA